MDNYVRILHRWRWVAVLAIVLYHVRFLLLVPYKDLEEKAAPLTLFYFTTSLGHEAFVVYMLTGGMLLGGRSLERWSSGSGGVWRDLASRAAWFIALFVPGVLLGGAFDMIGYGKLEATGVYAYFDQFTPDFSLSAFAGNLVPIQRFLVPGLGSNSMLYLLAYECWAYCAFALFVLGDRRRIVRAVGIAIALLGMWLAPEFSGYLLLWLLGATSFHYRKQLSAGLPIGPAFACFIVTLMLSRMLGPHVSQLDDRAVLVARTLLDLQLGLGLAVLLAALANVGRRAGPRASARVAGARRHRQVPGATGTVILASHFPFMMLTVAVLSQAIGLPVAGQPTPTLFLVLLLMVAAIYVYARALSWLAAGLVRSVPYPRARLS